MFRTTGLAIATIRWISPTLGADDDGLASDPTALASHATPTVVYALSDATRRIWWNGAWRRCRPWLRIRRRALAGRALADVRARASPGGKRLVARCFESKWYWTGGSEARVSRRSLCPRTASVSWHAKTRSRRVIPWRSISLAAAGTRSPRR